MSYTRGELDKMNEVSPELAAALERRPFPDLSQASSFREARAAHLRGLRHLMPVPGPIPDQVVEEEHLVPARDGYKIKVVSYRPAQPATPGPLIVLFHEGGWMVGDLSDEEFNARLFARDLGATCLNVEYRLAPEHKFPTGVNDCWDAVQWAARSAESLLHANPTTKGFIVGGSSAGGNLGAVCAHLSRDTNLQPPITGQWLSVAFLMPSDRVPAQYQSQFVSMSTSAKDPVLRPFNDVQADGPFVQMLGPDFDSPLFSVVSPQLYPPTPESLASKPPLAPAYFQIAGLDPLRDGALVYDRILQEEYGVATRVDIYSGFGHMFWTNWPDMDASKKFAEDAVAGVKWLLTQPKRS